MTTLRRSQFPFLDLPAELRLIIYEFLPIQTKHVAAECEADPGVFSGITLLVYHIPTQLLRESVRQTTPRVSVEVGAKNMLINGDGIFTHAMAWFMALKKNVKADFREWAASENFDEFTNLKPTEVHLPVKLPRGTLQFVQQTGIQMMQQW